ncbi:MAG: hypothetical protein PUF03_09960 [Lachnospiraceae bacterium]|nr:hypothetical protein [Lachnospiraceae bacterium]
MGKDTHLVNIYLKIHNKKPLTMDDLRYLAEYAPECFEKTCKNVVYNVPESKPVMEPDVPNPREEKTEVEATSVTPPQPGIDQVLENLKRLEADDFPVVDIDPDKLKNLLGNLYMEMLFPHNERDTFMDMMGMDNKPLFDKKA